ncbi:cupin domain-containing protein [Halalkalibacterium halodurans]|uniref:cupin domain-containing protein n=1 Tax=Halalkalibacterium halodurans TaxID=86665 RepID=UPI002E23D822|nr:cupin domain-containing protein [Halalkalibacterium halodurans]
MEKSPLVHEGGRSVAFLKQGVDEKGAYLLVEHRMMQQGAVNGPHWHPVLQETFIVKEGQMRFVIDGEEKFVEAGEQVTIEPKQVHQFWNMSEERLVAKHEVRPPGNHWAMFELLHKLEVEGKVNQEGIPTNPLWVGVAWELMDGYIKGPPLLVQKVVFGGLAKLAKIFGYYR